MLGRGVLGSAEPAAARRCARSPRALPNLADLPGADAFPGVPDARPSPDTRAHGTSGSDERSATCSRRPPRGAPTHARSTARSLPHRRLAFGRLSLDTVKAIKNAASASPSTTSWWRLCAAALREWLIERDELPDEPLVAMVPVSVRTEEQQGTFGNRVSMMIVPIADRRGRSARAPAVRTHELLLSAKERHQARARRPAHGRHQRSSRPR